MNNQQEKISILRNDSLSDIFAKISKQDSGKDLYLEIEEDSVLRHYINTKLLLSRFPNRKIIFVSADVVLKKIAEGLGIKFFFKNENIEFEEKYTKAHVLRYNFTFLEFLLYEMHKFSSKIMFLWNRRSQRYKSSMFKKDSHVLLLVFGLIMSFSLLGFIFYFTVSKTYVYITPELSVKTASRNLIFTEKSPNEFLDKRNVINVRNAGVTASSDYNFHISTLDFNSAQVAQGKADLINELTQEQSFRPNTRFVTEEGFVFRSSEWVKIPGARIVGGKVVPGIAEMTLRADSYDTHNNVIGKRGNIIKGKLLVAPGLKFNRDKIYAKAKENFIGGDDPKYHILTKAELEKLQGIALEKVKEKALSSLKEKVRAQNMAENKMYEILPIDESVRYYSGAVGLVDNKKIGDRVEDINIRASVAINAYVYDKDAAVFYLKTIMNETLLSGTEKLIGVQNDSLRISGVLSRTDNPLYLKATTDLDATIAYNFEDGTNNLTKKLKNLIVNTSQKDATSILLNDPNIETIKFQFMPFWVSRVSSNPDNIEFVILK